MTFPGDFFYFPPNPKNPTGCVKVPDGHIMYVTYDPQKGFGWIEVPGSHQPGSDLQLIGGGPVQAVNPKDLGLPPNPFTGNPNGDLPPAPRP
jgi:hypothetical protein